MNYPKLIIPLLHRLLPYDTNFGSLSLKSDAGFLFSIPRASIIPCNLFLLEIHELSPMLLRIPQSCPEKLGFFSNVDIHESSSLINSPDLVFEITRWTLKIRRTPLMKTWANLIQDRSIWILSSASLPSYKEGRRACQCRKR